MKNFKQNLAASIVIAASPLIVVSVIWLLTLGSFDYIEVMRSVPAIVVTSTSTLIATSFLISE